MRPAILSPTTQSTRPRVTVTEMALKRKSLIDTDSPPFKKLHKDTLDELPKQDSDDHGDFKSIYTDSGTPRAESEARRQWTYVCPVESCGQRFNRPCRLENHMRSHSNERPFACPEIGCDKTFPRKDHLQRHIKNTHGDPALERSYFCDWNGCDKSFSSNARLQRHKAVHESKFYCNDFPPCNQVFRKANVLEAHIKSEHLQLKPYPCSFVDLVTGDICTAGYQTEASLRRHVNNSHSGIAEDGHFCMLCTGPDGGEEMLKTESGGTTASPVPPLSFATRKELMTHVEECHPPTCSDCGQKFTNTSSLKSHWNTLHGDPKQQPQFPCPWANCESIFNRKHNLTVHIQSVHNKEAKFFCTSDAQKDSKHDDLQTWNGENACGAAFKAKSSLDQHIRTHHLGLGTRKQLRKAAKSRKKPEPSMLTLLTGVGYEEGREIACLMKTCEYRFYRDVDLRRHLCAEHGASEDEVAELIQERNALAGGRFWIGGLEEQEQEQEQEQEHEHMNSNFESTEPSLPQTPLPYFFQGGVPLYTNGGGEQLDGTTTDEPQFVSEFDERFDDMSLVEEDAEMDKAMGLDGMSSAMDIQDGLGWAMPTLFDQSQS